MLTIGLSGATCSGKSSSSVASMLEKVLTSCMVINQDKSMESMVKNQILLGKWSFGEVVSAEYNNEKVAIKKMENGEDAIVEMAINSGHA